MVAQPADGLLVLMATAKARKANTGVLEEAFSHCYCPLVVKSCMDERAAAFRLGEVGLAYYSPSQCDVVHN